MAYEGYRDYFEKKLIISVATTGGLHGKEANPNLPEQPEEVVEDLVECREAGASIVHLHARDEDGENTKAVSRFQELRDRIAEAVPDMVVNFTTGGSDVGEYRIRPTLEVEPRPEIATIDLGPLNWGQSRTSLNPREQNEAYAAAMTEAGVRPELELFNSANYQELYHLVDEGLLEKPYWCTVIMGMQSGTPPAPRNLLNLVDNLPDGAEWQCLAIGKHQLPLTTMAMVAGGHVRVGLEDNVYYRYGELAESNAQLVRRAARIASELERPIATPEETREILDL